MTKAISIRMYNVGLGDSFLLRFPAADRERKVLIDCGVHASGPGPHKMIEVVDQIIQDVSDGGTPAIDVVIATHRHRDHVLGFESEKWRDVEVGEVWMPWTEDPKDPKARKIRDTQSKKAQAIAMALRLAGADQHILDIAENSLVNAKAMATLHNGFAGKPARKFLPPKLRDMQSFKPDLLDGVIVHAMGPSRDPEVIRDMNPPEGGAFKLRGSAAGSGGDGSMAPFDDRYELSGALLDQWLQESSMSKRDLRSIEKAAEENPLALVVQLDKAVNGTSLMLMFEMGNAHLLFPGDAQWGTWQNALADDTFHSLLEKTTFYKVGHHGSHNATPKDFVETILEKNNFVGMCCTRPTTKFKKIPLTSLMKALNAKSGNRIARSDDLAKVKGFTRDADIFTETQIAV